MVMNKSLEDLFLKLHQASIFEASNSLVRDVSSSGLTGHFLGCSPWAAVVRLCRLALAEDNGPAPEAQVDWA